MANDFNARATQVVLDDAVRLVPAIIAESALFGGSNFSCCVH